MKIKMFFVSLLMPAMMAMEKDTLKRCAEESAAERCVKQKVEISAKLIEEIEHAVSHNDFGTYFKLIESIDKERLTNEMCASLYAYPMHCAAFFNNAIAIEKLASMGVSVEIIEWNDSRPLHQAAASGSLGAIAMLLCLGADIHGREDRGYTPLHYAAEFGQADTIRFLVKQGAKKDSVDEDGETPLHKAARYGKLDAVKMLIALGADCNIYGDASALHWAAVAEDEHEFYGLVLTKEAVREKTRKYWEQFDHSGVVLCLLQAGIPIDLNGCVEYGDLPCGTPLHIAAYVGNLELVKCLIDAGAPFNSRNEYGFTPLNYAANLSADEPHIAVTRYLIERGALVNERADNGYTLLHLAARWGWIDVISDLVKRGADINAKNNNGDMPLQMATNRHSCYALIKLGADTKGFKFNKGHFCDGKYDEQFVKAVLLFTSMKNPNVKDKNGVTLLMWASATGFEPMVKDLLKDEQADVNQQDNAGNTALHYAASAGDQSEHGNILESLLHHEKINKYLQNKNGDTPFHCAVFAKNLAAIKSFLIRNTSQVSPPNKRNKTVADLAEESTPEIKAKIAHVLAIQKLMKSEEILLVRLPQDLQQVVLSIAIQNDCLKH